MNIPLQLSIDPMKHTFWIGAFATLASASSAFAAPAGLGFDVTARVSAAGKNQLPAQTILAHVVLSGSKARVETKGAGSRSVVLFTPPFVYRLLPDSRAGVKWKLSQASSTKFGGFDPQQLLRNPSQIRAALLSGGAKRTGVGVLGGVPVEVFEASKPGQKFSRVRAWIRRSDSLPLRLEATNGGLKVVASWSRYTRLSNVSAAQFAPPKGFAIREMQNPPTLPLL